MEINLSVLRSLLIRNFGYDSYISSFVEEIVFTDKVPTAGITKDGQLNINKNFVDKYVDSETDLFCLIIHEIMHPMFNHFIYDCTDKINHIACDAVINSTICALFGEASGYGSLFKKFYSNKKASIECLLRPGCNDILDGNKLFNIYFSLYVNKDITTVEVIEALKNLFPQDMSSKVKLLGSHGGKPSGDEKDKNSEGDSEGDTDEENKEEKYKNSPGESDDSKLTKEEIEKIAESLEEYMKNSKEAGEGGNLIKSFIKLIKSNLSLKKKLVKEMLTNKKIDNFKDEQQRERYLTLPFPINPGKRDIVNMAVGINNFYYKNINYYNIEEKKGVVVYLDVSGSVMTYLPKIIGFLVKNFKGQLDSLYQFSTSVSEISLQNLIKGEIHTTYGTSFDCVARSIVDNGYDKAIIITDGFSRDVRQDLFTDMKKLKLKTLNILFDGVCCPSFEEFGDTIFLEDLK